MTLHEYINSIGDEVVCLLKTLCQIPAPSNQEKERAEFCKTWITSFGGHDAYIDDQLNMIYPYALEVHEKIVVFMAHTDTVFPDNEPMPLSCKDGKMYCPGVGDNSANLAVLLSIMKYFATYKPETTYGVLFVANSGEEGLGNLKGSREIVRKFGERIIRFVSFDGYYTGICTRAVGSSRFEVIVKTVGGHSFFDFGKPSAIKYLAEIITEFYKYKPFLIDEKKTTYNVGVIFGGTSVNSIAQSASMFYEYRSDDIRGLEECKAYFDSILSAYMDDQSVKIEIRLVGTRPCSIESNNQEVQTDLESFTYKTIEAHTGKKVKFESGSTDSNIPLSLGIPALTVGVCIGGGAHTREEWVELESLEKGLSIASDIILYCCMDKIK